MVHIFLHSVLRMIFEGIIISDETPLSIILSCRYLPCVVRIVTCSMKTLPVLSVSWYLLAPRVHRLFIVLWVGMVGIPCSQSGLFCCLPSQRLWFAVSTGTCQCQSFFMSHSQHKWSIWKMNGCRSSRRCGLSLVVLS